MIITSASIAIAFPLTLAVLGVSSGDVVHAATGGVSNLADLLGQRSPGERTSAQLTKTKKAQHALAKQRVIPKLKPAPPAEVDLASIVMPPAPQLPVERPVAMLDAKPLWPALLFTPPPSGGPVAVPPGAGGGIVPGGGGPQTPPTEQPRPPVPAPSPLPEPGTWATMLLGFGMLGWNLRRRSRTAVPRAA